MPAPAPAEAPKGTARRDQLLEMQTRVQAKWEASKAFEVDAPAGTWDGGKFMVTFPYPYMNGKLHLGHAFSLTKAEFAAAYQRMLGKKALFPFAFHCTGMPIQAAAFKLKKEYDAYGQPLPNFPASPPEVVESDPDNSAITIGWKAPTSTGGKPLTGFAILVREGVSGEYVEKAKVDATGAEPGAQFSHTVEGLTVGSQYGFQVVTIVDGLPGVPGRKLEKSADGKHPLALLASKKDASKDDKKGGGGGAPAKKPAAKVQAKTGGMMTQWDILISMGFSPEAALAFVDPVHWLKVFPPLGKTDLLKLGVGVDWRRAFLTTDYNPYYDSFVRWQFYQLKHGDFIAFGKRPSIFSEADAQPCMDHDRDKGEGVGHQEYVALKILLLEPLPAVLADSALKDKKIYCLAATLRPETMCGQTNVDHRSAQHASAQHGAPTCRSSQVRSDKCVDPPRGGVRRVRRRARRGVHLRAARGPQYGVPGHFREECARDPKAADEHQGFPADRGQVQGASHAVRARVHVAAHDDLDDKRDGDCDLGALRLA